MMSFKDLISKYKNVIYLVLGFIVTAGAYLWFLYSPYFQGFVDWTETHKVLYFSFLISIKILAIIWPPLPGGFFTLGAVPVIGWKEAFLADAIGSVIGSSITYFIGKRFGYIFIKKLFDEEVLNKIRKVKIKDNKQIEAVVVLRIVIMEAICYSAGLLGISFKSFLAGTIIGHAVTVIPTFYLTENILSSKNIGLVIVKVCLYLILIGFLILYKNRYLEQIDTN